MDTHIGRVHGHRWHAGGQRQAATMWRSTVRCIVTLILVLLLVPLASEAQLPGTIPRIAYLAFRPGPCTATASCEGVMQGLRELGYVEGQNIFIEYRWSAGDVDRLRENAAELVRLGVDVIVTGGPVATRAAQDMTRTIPIVMARDFDPVGDGFVAGLARPGGNITGVSALDLSGKRLELLKGTVPGLARVAVLWNPVEPNAVQQVRDTEDAARGLGLQVQALEVRGLDEFEGAFAAARQGRADGLIVLRFPGPAEDRTRLVDLAAQSRLPTIYWQRAFVEAGGLMSYAASEHDLSRRAASYVDRILKGAKPADLPVEQAIKFALVINLKTAKALGITMPPSLLLLADEMIQ
jgi:ABC-type uncharacterized transport system substrate-binding protein